MQTTVLIAGTSTGVGKTVLTLAIASYYQTFHPQQSLAVFKPIDIESRDQKTYEHVLSPTTHSDDGVSKPFDPFIAASIDGQFADLAVIWKQYQTKAQSHDVVLMEAYGSLGTPLTPETTVADLAWDWRLPTILVVPVQPGAIGQAIAHVALARYARVHLKGVVLNCVSPSSNRDADPAISENLIQSFTQIPVLGCIPFLDDVSDRTKLAHVASNLEIERILPFI